MKYLRQFCIILLISALGEGLHILLPLPVPASVYGLVLMLGALTSGILKLEQVEDAADFLGRPSGSMGRPAADLASCCDHYDSDYCDRNGGYRTQHPVCNQERQEEREEMIAFIENSLFFGAALSLVGYEVGLLLKKKFKMALFNPLLIAILCVMGVLQLMQVDYKTYNAGGQYISYLLTPATVCLAVPLYRQLTLLRKNLKAVIIGIVSGVLASMISVLIFAKLFGLSHSEYVTLLPKSITTAIGMGVSEELGGLVTITVAVIIITGVLGNVIAEAVCKIAKIEEPIAKGLALGTSAHAIGTAKAMEMGPVEGAMSSLAIAVAGLLTVITASVFAGFM